MSALSDGRRAEIEARLSKATPGPWRRADDDTFYQPDALKCASPLSDGLGERILISANHHFPYEADLDFIVHAPEDIRDLLRDGAAVRAERDELKRLLAEARRTSRGFTSGYMPTHPHVRGTP